MYDSRHPKQMDEIERINDENKALDKQKSEQDKIANGEKTAATDGRTPTPAEIDEAEKESKSLDKKIKKNNDAIVEIQKDFTGTQRDRRSRTPGHRSWRSSSRPRP